MSQKVANALLWIKYILEEQDISYQIVGGLASAIHGGSRPVVDIDLYIPTECAEKLLPKVQGYMSKPLIHCVEGAWDLEYFQLIYHEQIIEIGLSPGTKIYDQGSGLWVELITDYSRSVMGEYQGIEVPVIPIPELVAYKALLGRNVDHVDIEELARIAK